MDSGASLLVQLFIKRNEIDAIVIEIKLTGALAPIQ
jgi:hypothetical protein